jgi:hypothetical protein
MQAAIPLVLVRGSGDATKSHIFDDIYNAGRSYAPKYPN